MNSRFSVPLAPFTTFHIGGPARVFIEAHTEEEVRDAAAYAREKNLPLYPLGAGSNLLVPDAGVDGVVVKMALGDIEFERSGDDMLLIAGAGALWEKIVDAASQRGLYGVENLAGIPGAIGGASVQNIGAYGAELADVFAYADCINSTTGARERIARADAAFAYRASFFKAHREYIIVRVAVRLETGDAEYLLSRPRACARKRRVALDAIGDCARHPRHPRKKIPLFQKRRHGRFFFQKSGH